MAATDLAQQKRAGDTKWIAKALVSFGIVAALYSAFFSKDAPKVSEAQKEAQCLRSLQCWGDRYNAAADTHCPAFVEKLARFSARWTDTGLFEPKFSRFRWLDESAGTLTYVGDKVEFQNAFGAWQPILYECDYDPRTKTILDVRIQPGRL